MSSVLFKMVPLTKVDVDFSEVANKSLVGSKGEARFKLLCCKLTVTFRLAQLSIMEGYASKI